MRLTLGIVTNIDFKQRLHRILQHFETSDVSSEICIDDELLTILALLNELGRQKFYCRKEQGWTHLFDVACYAWQSRKLEL